jgi:hypothetical protein
MTVIGNSIAAGDGGEIVNKNDNACVLCTDPEEFIRWNRMTAM